MCIISVYMPNRGNNTKSQYSATLKEVEELVEKYSHNHALFVCGDFNASLSRQSANERDILLRYFVEKHQLIN